MNSSDMAPMIVMVTGIITAGLVLILRPISKRLGVYLEVLADQHRRELNISPMDRTETARIAQLVENVDARLERIEERQDFTDRLLAERKEAPRALP
ncbi:MAG TPA: hypothetical protein VM100_13885 [Longimicrobiales bacterium]|nr:hypothetical protein [Longimicrobiales bacterium]